jgi:mono/diheme cytochrome c family protein
MVKIAKCVALSFALLLSFGYLLHSSTAQNKKSSSKRSSHSAIKAESLFQQNCARCHGADGRGETTLGKIYGAPDFTESEWWREHKSSKEQFSVVTYGKGGMPAFGKKLAKEEIASLVAYVRRFKKK